MKKFTLSTILAALLLPLSLLGQTGPGGIATTNNILWLDASKLALSNNDPVSSWTDISGNSNHATQGTGALQPTFKTSQLNGNPIVEFTGTEYLTLGSNITDEDISWFIIYKRDGASSSLTAPFNLGKHFFFSSTINTFLAEYPGTSAIHVSKTDDSYSVLSANVESAGKTLNMYNGKVLRSATFSNYANTPNSLIGASYYSGRARYFLDGGIAEIIGFNTKLSSAERKIVSQYLATKYNLTPETTLYSYGSTHGGDLKGIGQESDGSNLTARGTDSLTISSPSAMGNGDYLFIGHDNGGYATSTSVGAGVSSRWTQVWRSDLTNTPGTVTLDFRLGANNLGATSTDDYVLLIDFDGDFTNGGTTLHETGRTYNASTNSISFSSVSLSDGRYFTIGLKNSDITSNGSGNWNNSATWSCSCIPGAGDIVEVSSGHTVTVDANSSVFELTVTGSLDFSGAHTLDIYSTLNVSGSLTGGSGTINAVQAIGVQTFNNTGGTIALNNLTVNNTNGLAIGSGNWTLAGNLQVTSGGLNVSSANSFRLLSTSTANSQILASMDNAFTGTFILERYIETRNANQSNMSAPISDATIGDLDGELDLSGVGGRSGDAYTVNPQAIFRSVYEYDPNADSHNAVTDTSTAMKVGKGYEVYLASTISTFNTTTVTYTGTPNVGEISYYTISSPSSSDGIYFNQGWNLLGNPYYSHIDFDLITKDPFMAKDYYIFNSRTGSYDFIAQNSSDLIPPGQGFWVFQSAPGNRWMTFEESNKVSSTSNDFIRRKENTPFSLILNQVGTPYQQTFHLNLNGTSTEKFDELDAPLLRSPMEEVPAIYSKASNSDMELMRNSLSHFENSHLIPVSIYAGAKGEYEIDVKNVEEIYNNYSCVYLKDNKTDEAIDLSVNQYYKFDADQGDDDRFALILSNSFEECNKLIENGQNAISQTIEDNLSLRNAYGVWYLDYTVENEIKSFEIKVFNMNGQEVASTASFSDNKSGSYPIRGLEGLNGVYLIQVTSNDSIIHKTVKL